MTSASTSSRPPPSDDDFYRGLVHAGRWTGRRDRNELYHSGAPAPHLPARAVARELQELQNMIAYHVDPLLGVTNEYVRDFCRAVTPPTLNTFLGVYPADAIPDRLAELPRGCMIVNLGHVDARRPHAGADERKEEEREEEREEEEEDDGWGEVKPERRPERRRAAAAGDVGGGTQLGHFVCVQLEPRQIYYIDPFGDACGDPCVLRFLQRGQRPIIMHRRPVQNRLSMFCSLYSILFTLRAQLPPPNRFSFVWDREATLHNDDRCVSYLRKTVKRLYRLREEEALSKSAARKNKKSAGDEGDDDDDDHRHVARAPADAASDGRRRRQSRRTAEERGRSASPVQRLPRPTDDVYAYYRDPVRAAANDAAAIAHARGEDVDTVG